MSPSSSDRLLEELPALFALQQIDVQLEKVRNDRAQLDDGTRLVQELTLLAADLQGLRKQVREHEANRNDKRLESQGLRDHMRELGDRLFRDSGTDEDQVKAIHMELESLRKRILELEEDIERLTEGIHQLHAQVEQKELEHQEKAIQHEEVRARYEQDVRSFDAALAELGQQRERLVQQLTETTVARYDLIRSRSDGLAVVEITSNVCPGCYIELTPFALRRLQEMETVQYCENCHRILYWRGERRFPQTLEDLKDYLQAQGRQRPRP